MRSTWAASGAIMSKKKRQEALAAGDRTALKAIRREYHHWNHTLRADAKRSGLAG